MLKAAAALFVLFMSPCGLQTAHGQDRHERRPTAHLVSRSDHGGDWMAHDFTQDARGFLYVANSWGVLEYDGARWELVEVAGNGGVYALATDANGLVWYGGNGDAGWIDTDEYGESHARSVLDMDDTILGIVAHDGFVYFLSEERLFIWDGAVVDVLSDPSGYRTMGVANSDVHVVTGNGRVRTVTRGVLLDGFTVDVGACCLVDVPGTELLLGFTDGRVYRVEEGQLRPYRTEAQPFLDANGLKHMSRMKDGSLVWASLYDGVLVTDVAGRISARLEVGSRASITSRTVRTYEDTFGGLWLGTENGPVRISMDSAVDLILDGRSEVYDMAVFHGEVLLSTASGLEVLGNPDALVAGPVVRATQLTEADDQLLFRSEGWLYRYGEGRVERLPWKVDCLFGSQWRPKTVLVCPDEGGIARLSYIRERDAWALDAPLPPIEQSVISMAESEDGWIWIVGGRNTVSRLHGSGAGSVEVWTSGEDYAPSFHAVEAALGKAWLTTGTDLYVFNPDEPGLFDRHGEAAWIFHVSPDKALVRRPGGYAEAHLVDGIPVLGEHAVPQTRFMAVFDAAPDGVIWGGNGTKVFRLDADRVAVPAELAAPTVRSIRVNDTSRVSLRTPLHLDANQNTIRFDFSTPAFLADVIASEGGDQTANYRHRLAPLFTAWSEWSGEAFAAYQRLPAGDYAFEVQARVVGGQETPVRRIDLIIRPEWHETLLVRLGAVALLLFLSILGTARWDRVRIERLRDRSVELERTVEDRTAVIREQANLLMERDASKSRFFANISHEIRTPLMLALGPLDSAMHGAWGTLDDRARKAVNRGRRNGIQVVRLVDQLLDLSKMEAGVLELHPTNVDLAALLRQLVSLFESYAEQYDVALMSEGLEAPFALDVDTDKVEKIVINLLSNALKFTPSGGSVTVRLDRDGPRHAVVTVEDTGVGIPEDQQAVIFERYRQLNLGGVDARGRYGVGIGLSLVRELAELHGGGVTVSSQPGRGSAFRVWFEGQTSVQPADSSLAGVDDHSFMLLSGLERGSEAVPRTEPDHAGTRATLLVVDDNPDMRAYIREDLESVYAVQEAGTGLEAMERALESIPDLVISDVNMPGMDGLEFCRLLKADVRTSHIPVILLTARTGDELRIAGIEVGADAHLEKPFNMRELSARIDMLLMQREHLQKRLSAEGLSAHVERDQLLVIDREFIDSLYARIASGMADTSFTVDDLADGLGVSRSQLYRKIDALLGETPNGLVRRLRIERAQVLLEVEGRSVKEAAHAVGFKSDSGFRKAYRAVLGRQAL